MIKSIALDIFDKIKGNNYKDIYQTITGIKNENDLLNFQNNKINSLFLHAYKYVPYYREAFKKSGIDDNEQFGLKDLKKLPILDKNTIRNNGSALASKELGARKWSYNTSGGSTGESVRFIQDEQYILWRNATNYYYYKKILGVDEKRSKKALLWGSERDIFVGSMGFKANFFNWLENSIFLNSFRMTESDMERYINKINSYKPRIVRGYAGSLYELCLYAEKNKKQIYSPDFIISSAETLTEDMRDRIEKNFGSYVYDYYGSREVSNLAGECKFGSKHVFSFWNIIEVLDENNEDVKEGETGKVVVTNLFNYSMPLLRYEIGDMAVQGSNKCKCGHFLPYIKKVTGRKSNNFLTKNNTVIYGEYFTHLFYLKDWIKKFRVVQEDYEKIKIMAVLNGEINIPEKNEIENKIYLVMGKNCAINWEFIEDIPVSKSGKYLYTISLINR
jgi:phenylacetate-CoA ligase